MKVAVLGIGLLGAEIALRLQQQGHEVIGVNRGCERPRFDAVRQRGLTVTADTAAAVANAEFILLLLSDAAAIQEMLFASATPIELRKRLVVQMGTIAPAESRALAAQIAALGGAYVEAPVLGSLPEARAGTLIVMAGGAGELFARCQPLLTALSPHPQHIGAVGQASALKLAMNQLIAGLTATFALSLGLVRHEGIAVEQFMALLRSSALYAPTFDKKLDNYLTHDYSGANFPLKHLHKDVRLFQQVAAESGLDSSVLAAIAAGCVRAESAGCADQDYSVLYEALTNNDH
ncbi:NAD(P)-dependent oxidoreductase [Chromatium okenii]|jgi:3-hydroxyisobutyrate dehydrogenase|uniref:Hydroxyacid dehydrogenase n=1 Tax=Chromatium okenii TaxID=61644 RepID=A0A2S7XQ59_9GAMM|nr:NAD(P)-dependent oxidoreductase [Chromatium okenii]MBV5307807.1 NAD(P)-dependent oxidoreductase [Chromatium okenii]PQJ95884.1 hydroxyacid dehydrogenase [Chromatium okenii]